MKLILSGSSGLVGSALVPVLREAGHEVIRLVRREPGANEIRWYPERDVLQPGQLGALDGFIHLGGDNIASGRWSEAKKRRIRESRVKSTQLIATTLANMDHKPSFFVCASAIGYYGDRGEQLLTEKSEAGSGFLAEVCREWEDATRAAAEAGIRVVNLRIGIVLSKHGAALHKMLLLFKLGLGGVIGSGSQYWSCISRDELVRVIRFVVESEQIQGPTNAVSVVVTNREFTKSLGNVLGRPTLFPMPAFAAKLVLGEMAEALMLCSARVVPEQLRNAQYSFSDRDIQSALRSALNEKNG